MPLILFSEIVPSLTASATFLAASGFSQIRSVYLSGILIHSTKRDDES